MLIDSEMAKSSYNDYVNDKQEYQWLHLVEANWKQQS